MRRLSLGLLAFSASLVATAPAWPPLNGELSGKFQLLDDTSVPPIAWRLQVGKETNGASRVELTAEAPGLNAHLILTPPHDGQPGAWQLADSFVALADWWRFAATRAGVAVKPADLRVSGTLQLAGEGTWDGAAWRGTLRAKISGAELGSEQQGWTASDVGATAELTFREKKFALLAAEVRAGTVQAAGFAAHRVVLEVAGAERGRFEVKRAQLETFGGRIALAPFTLDPAAPAVRTAAEFSGVALGELAALVPQALSEGRGHVAGKISVNWSLASGFEPQGGSLVIAADAPATLRLAPSPGLLTGRAPPRIAFLPAWTGPLRHWSSVENPAYDSLHRIELGEIPLAVENLHAELFPDGPDGARTAVVEVAARPIGASAVERVKFTVNVSGPLTQVLRLGMNERAKIHVAPSR